MKLAASLYLTLPGIPFVYYGEEIGMTGSGDHLNIRRPMQWTDSSHAGFSTTTPWQSVGTNYVGNNVKVMDENPNSILRHYKKLIRIRNEQEALRRGQTLLVDHDSDKVFSFARIGNDDAIVVVTQTGTTSVSPTLSLSISAFPAGVYYITELLSNQAFGQITINDQGGFSDLQISGQQLAGLGTWILLFSEDNPITGIIEPETKSNYRLTPNPAKEYIQIECVDGIYHDADIHVYSSDGKLMHHQGMNADKIQINVSGWLPGVYFIQVVDDKKNIVERLVFNKS
jgi:hypothetical protein